MSKVMFKSDVAVLRKFQLLAKKEQELKRAEMRGMSKQYQEYLENVVAALQQTLSR